MITIKQIKWLIDKAFSHDSLEKLLGIHEDDIESYYLENKHRILFEAMENINRKDDDTCIELEGDYFAVDTHGDNDMYAFSSDKPSLIDSLEDCLLFIMENEK